MMSSKTRSLSMLLAIAALLMSACTTPANAAGASEAPVHAQRSELAPARTVLSVRTDRHLQVALKTSHDLLDGNDPPTSRADVVACGPAVEALVAERMPPELATQIERLTERGSRVVACGLSLHQFQVDADQLHPRVTVVDNAFIEIFRLQRQGFLSIEL
ncbi:hypothetical protein DV096_10765 [Bradymonadaceae bacterium TMQ3]|uniref:Sulfur reduction protein DsrE n=1 Tax=Lujinxingia sediminis TaxID=2480984 RepID=A0ABY0CT27_9DELT|nr:DsrE family protein [Lujinxingia sediminis]RDV38281.1 hypothetical protein DV096_10765 [Bradymonadaceae bacterium TMQ3]RVU43516.1 hypothetical protein EA187_11855 [Lujinxingia sediminis]TXC75955.1 hypothetical protein FRC91_10680 [Bradymonadales bacterium TMQ1]